MSEFLDFIRGPRRTNERVYVVAMLLIALAFTVYFAVFVVNEYSTFNVDGDLAGFAYNFYFNLHYPQIAHGLQYLAIDGHMSPYLVLFLPLFLLNGGALTVLFIQLLTITATGVAIFFVTRSLTKDSLLAFIFSFAFFVYPGTLGITIYGAHVEFPIPLFYILTFYFYVKRDKLWFAVSALLLAATAEVTPILILFLAAGLFLFEYRRRGALFTSGEKTPAQRNAWEKAEKPFILALLAIGVLSLIFYLLAYSALVKGYEIGAYQSLPHGLYITQSTQAELLPSLVSLVKNPLQSVRTAYDTYVHGFLSYFIYGIALVILGYGITLLFVPDVALAFALPWLAGVFLLTGDPSFVLPYDEYFSFVIGPVVCASILGALVLRQANARRNAPKAAQGPYGSITKKVYLAAVILPLLFSIAAPALYLYVASPFSRLHIVTFANLDELLLFQVNASQQAAYSQLDSVIQKVPANASLITDPNIMPHVTQRKQLESFYNASTLIQPNPPLNMSLFTPDYMLVDRSSLISSRTCEIEDCSLLSQFLSSGQYAVYAQNGTAILYKRG